MIKKHTKNLILSALILGLMSEKSLSENNSEHSPLGKGIIIGDDDRVPSSVKGVGRIDTVGCTGWIISNGAILTAGHCIRDNKGNICPSNKKKIVRMNNLSFNVPLSNDEGSTNPSLNPDVDVYPIDKKTIRCGNNPNIGSDWAIFSVGRNKKGQQPYEVEKSFFRPINLLLPSIANSIQPPVMVRVTGYGVDGPAPEHGHKYPRNKYSQTQQTAIGPLYEQVPSSASSTAYYKVDTMGGNSGSPVSINGTSLAIAIHQGSDSNINHGTQFTLQKLNDAIQAFPGLFLSPIVPGSHIYYIDNGVVGFTENSTGNILSPFARIEEALAKVSVNTSPSVISVVGGTYAGTLNHNVANLDDITVNLSSDLTMLMPVGDVTLWEPEKVQM